MERDRMRAGDGDREAVAQRLKTALDEGRLDLHEYDERLQQTYAAKTFADLDGLTSDLPGTGLPGTATAQRSQLAPQPPMAAPVAGSEIGEVRKPGGPPWLASYGGLVLVCVLIWAISSFAAGDLLYFWPVWMLIPLIFGAIGQMTGRAARRDGRGHRGR